MEKSVHMPLKEYEKMKREADFKKIPVEVGVFLGPNRSIIECNINIDMRELKLKICEQQGIDPSKSIVNFY